MTNLVPRAVAKSRNWPLKSAISRLFAVGVTTTLVLTGCSGAENDVPSAGGEAEIGATADINPQDPATLRQGGNLRLALSGFPPNFNYLHVDGNLAELGGMLRATLPRAFFIKPDG